MRSDIPVKGAPSFSTSLYHFGKFDCSRFMFFDHEVMKKDFGEGLEILDDV